MSNESVMAELHKDYIHGLIIQGKRMDGRALDEYRDISIETGYVEKAEGSAKVLLGDTQLVVGVKIQPGEPFADSPGKGVIIVNTELIPTASPSFESGPPGEKAVELARLTDRGIRQSGAIDLEKLCITEGEKVWLIFIDVHVLDDGGNIMDASELGAMAALTDARIPKERYELGTDEPLPVRDVPVAITFVEIAGELVLDPTYEEEQVAGCKLTIIVKSGGSIAGMQKSGAGTLSQEQLKRAVHTAIEKADEIRSSESVREKLVRA